MRNNQSTTWALILGFAILSTYIFLHFYYGLFDLPYFWDELGVYSRAALHMAAHGIGLLPSSLPDELSRGHPILIPFIFGVGFKLFGCKVFVAKIIAALIYSLGIFYIYRIFLLIFSAKVACIFSFLIFIQPCFLSQSVLILPEIPLTVAAIIAFYYFLREKYLLVSVALIISLFIKESAVILPFAFYAADFLINRFKLKNFILLLILPLLCIVLFFAIQHYQRGYIFYPLHTSLVKLEMYFINERYRDLSKFLFYGQGRAFIWFYLPALFVAYKLIRSYKDLSFKFRPDFKSFNFRLYITIGLLLAAGVSFSVLNYFITRYSLYYLVFFYIGFFAIFFRDTKWNFLHYLAIAGILASAVIYNNDDHYTDVNFSYVDHVRSCEKAIDYLNIPENSDKTIAMDFPISVCTWDKNSGYFDTLYFQPKMLGDTAQMQDDYYVFTYPGNIDNVQSFGSKLTPVKLIQSGYAYVIIYRKTEK